MKMLHELGMALRLLLRDLRAGELTLGREVVESARQDSANLKVPDERVTLVVAMADPLQFKVIDELEFSTQRKVVPVVSTSWRTPSRRTGWCSMLASRSA